MRPNLAALAALAALCTACASPVVIHQPAESYVAADRATYEALAPALEGFAEADLARPVAERVEERTDLELQILIELLDTWGFRIQQAEGSDGGR